MKRVDRPGRTSASLMLLALVFSTAAAPPVAAEGPDYKGGTLAFLNLIVEGKHKDATAYFNDQVANALSAGDLGKLWKALESQAGAFQKFGEPKVSVVSGHRVVDVPAQFAWKALTLRVAWDDEGAVAGFHILPPGQSPSADPPPTKAQPTPAPKPAPPPSDHSEVTIGSDPWKLPGTLTIPTGGTAPYPAAILLHGSGPNDRDETIGPNKPFRELAEWLSAKGIAVLRYDKRTRVYPMAIDPKKITVEQEVLADASEAIRFLQGRSEIDPKRIHLVGHSLGGTLAPIVGERHPDLAGVAILAGTARPLLDVIDDQLATIGSLESDSASAQAQAIADLRATVRALSAPDAPDSAMILGMSVRYIRDLDAREPWRKVGRLGMKVFVAQGERDYQATMADFDVWRQALADHPRATFKAYPRLNHLFQVGEGKATPAEYMQSGMVSSELIGDLTDWILRP